MFLLDSLLIGGLRFVFDKIATVADQEMNDPDVQKERLLEAQTRLDQGEIDEAEFAAIEADVFDRLREIQGRTQTFQAPDDEHRIAGVEITVVDDADEAS